MSGGWRRRRRRRGGSAAGRRAARNHMHRDCHMLKTRSCRHRDRPATKTDPSERWGRLATAIKRSWDAGHCCTGCERLGPRRCMHGHDQG